MEGMSEFYFREAVNTLKATRWELLCARFFGKKREATDNGTTVVFREWRDKLYLIDVKESK